MDDKPSTMVRLQTRDELSFLNLFSTLSPAISRKEAKQQVVELLELCFPSMSVEVEIVSSALKSMNFPGDNETISLEKLLTRNVCCRNSLENSYLLLRIINEHYGVIKFGGYQINPDDLEEPGTALNILGAVRLILSNGILSDENREKTLQNERACTAYEKTEHHFRFLYENSPLPYQSVGKNDEIIEVNKAWLDVLGYEEHEVLGKGFERFLPKDQYERYYACIERLKKTGEVRNIELEVCKNNGTSILIQLDGAISVDVSGNMVRSHFIFLNVSEQNRIQQLILQSDKLSTIAGLAAGIAHELNTPLSGIMQSVQLIEMFLDPRNEKNARLAEQSGVDLNKLQTYLQKQDLDYFIDGIRGSAIKASRIIRSLLDFSRPTDAEFEFASLADLVELVISLIHTDYDLKKKYDVINIRIETEYDPKVPVIHCVPVEIEQVILNIVKNSVHALGESKAPDPLIRVRTSRDGEFVRIEIEDNGPGITNDIKKHAFDPFFTTKAPGEGTGLGLSVSYTFVVEKHKGRIRFDPNFSNGTRVIVELPINTIAVSPISEGS